MPGRRVIVALVVLVIAGGAAFVLGIATSNPSAPVVSLESLREQQVIHLEEQHLFLVYNDGSPLALSDDAQHLGDRVVFCDSSQMFESGAHGERFDIEGRYFGGPAQKGLDRYGVRLEGDGVYVDLDQLIPGPERGDPPAAEPAGNFCVPV
jgi:nitrite reductase/ring-hydroxylating ferredoxin subunit